MARERTAPVPESVEHNDVVPGGTDTSHPSSATIGPGRHGTTAPDTTPPPASELSTRPATERGDMFTSAVRTFGGLLANVTVITGLLVYFGWRRSATHAERLGIDESILGMSTRDYVIRSIGPVLALLIGIAVAGLMSAWLDRHLVRWLVGRRSGPARSVTFRFLALAWLVFPLIVVGLGYVWRAGAYVLFPASIGAGVLAMAYGGHLRERLDGGSRGNLTLTRVFAGVIVAACLFWTASNYAEVLGNSLADSFTENIGRLTGVVVYSDRRLFVDAPGSREAKVADDQTGYRYRYSGLRLFEHTGGTYFLISDRWSPGYGVVIALKDDDAGLRLEFVRDRR